MLRLNQKRALVTSGGQGIGRAICLELMHRGCDVVVHYFTSANGAEDLRAMADSLGVRAFTVQGDLTIASVREKLVQEAVSLLGGLDILVNNAGGLVERRTLDAIDEEFWQQVAAINVSTALQITRLVLPHLEKSGQASVVNLASLAGRKGGHAGSLAYSMCKGAILTMTRALATELGPKGIRVNAVAPGLILNTSFHNTHTSVESAAETIRSIPLGRAGTPEDVARAVAFLASEAGGFITGATLDINGGVYAA